MKPEGICYNVPSSKAKVFCVTDDDCKISQVCFTRDVTQDENLVLDSTNSYCVDSTEEYKSNIVEVEEVLQKTDSQPVPSPPAKTTKTNVDLSVELPEREWTSTISEGAIIKSGKTNDGYRVDITFNKVCDLKYLRNFTNEDLMIFKQEKIGPDEVLVHLEGASIQVQVAKTDDFCSNYYSIFQIPNAGIYRLKVIRLRQNYSAVMDGDFYPEITYEEFLDVKVADDMPLYAPQPCRIDLNGYWVTITLNLPSHDVTRH
jgi:hypothetical protein